MKKIQGIPAAPGIAIGPIFIHKSASLTPHEHPVADTAAEWARLTAALERARGQLQVIREKALNSTGAESAAIFDAQAAMLGDPELLERCRKDLASRQINVEVVWRHFVEHFAGSLEALENATLRARAADVRDVGQRVLRVLAGGPEEPPILRQPSIIVAEDLTPSDTIMFDRSLVLGFCTAGGGATSHTAILARSLGLPAVVGAGSELLHLADGGSSVLNGEAGSCWWNRTPPPWISGRQRGRHASDCWLRPSPAAGTRPSPSTAAGSKWWRILAASRTPGGLRERG